MYATPCIFNYEQYITNTYHSTLCTKCMYLYCIYIHTSTHLTRALLAGPPRRFVYAPLIDPCSHPPHLIQQNPPLNKHSSWWRAGKRQSKPPQRKKVDILCLELPTIFLIQNRLCAYACMGLVCVTRITTFVCTYDYTMSYDAYIRNYR